MSHARIGHRKILRVNDLKIFSLQEEVPSMNPSQLYRLSDLCWHLSNSYTTRRAPAGCHVERTTRCGVWYRCGPLEQYDNTNMTCDIWTMPPSRCGGVERVLRSTAIVWGYYHQLPLSAITSLFPHSWDEEENKIMFHVLVPTLDTTLTLDLSCYSGSPAGPVGCWDWTCWCGSGDGE